MRIDRAVTVRAARLIFSNEILITIITNFQSSKRNFVEYFGPQGPVQGKIKNRNYEKDNYISRYGNGIDGRGGSC